MNESHITLKSYIIGGVLSLLFTLAAYFAATSHTLSSRIILILIIACAFFQLIAQLIFFLHLGKESKPRWNIFIFFTTLIGIVILVFGSLWIMHHLNYNMTPHDTATFIVHDEGMQSMQGMQQ
jgi:cytochrome o ubiquinol oxidase operon protein cyoD